MISQSFLQKYIPISMPFQSFLRKETRILAVFTGIILLSVLMRLMFLTSSKLLVEEAYYWNYAMHLDFGYLDHPPMVALLIKIGTLMFGNTEFAVRVASPICWCGTVYFSYKLTDYLCKGAGLYAMFLLSILPFTFIHSMIITPDVPLLLCWSAALYYFYKALVLDEANAWYAAGFWCGLGLLSKYTMVLLLMPTFFYVVSVKEARKWLWKKEPWIALMLAVLLFTPVLYWNASHEWASFTFQSTRRFADKFHFSLPAFIGLVILFLTPAGIWSVVKLIKKDEQSCLLPHAEKSRTFLLYYLLIPLIFFGLFSLFRLVKFNWTGPVVLALIPWLSLQLYQGSFLGRFKVQNLWLVNSGLILGVNLGLFLILCLGQPHYWYQKLFTKYINWQAFTLQIHHILKDIPINSTPVIIPLDLYNMASQLNFYQAKLFERGEIDRIFPVSGRQMFGETSLMYDYWTPSLLTSAQPVLLIAKELYELSNPAIIIQIDQRSAPLQWLPHTQGNLLSSQPYFYQFGVVH